MGKKYEKDIIFVAACLSNDEKAWLELISTYKPICKIISQKLGAAHCFDDLFSDFILKLFGTSNGKPGVLKQYHGGVFLKTFLSTVFRHIVIDYLRKKKINISTKIPIEQHAEQILSAGLEYSELETELWRALNLLSVLERKIIELYYYNNLNIREIAIIISWSKSKVGRTIKEIRWKLRKSLYVGIGLID